MAEDVQNVFTVTALPTDASASETKVLSGATALSDSSSFVPADGDNVSFVNITYTIQPKSFFKKAPPKKILNDVR